jgi:Recombinase
LLSFAQFERELIAERTRDKMRLARRQGKWLGGNPILGYDVDPQGGGLKINDEEAQRVRFIYEQVAARKSSEKVLDELTRRGWTTKTWISKSGRAHNGRAFNQSDLIRLIKNVTYVGKLRDGEQLFPGEHTAVIGFELWERANVTMDELRPCRPAERRNRSENTASERTAELAAPFPVPRISRLLALALKMEQMIQEGTVKNYSELAHLGQVSAARITQVMNLLYLAPDIQEQILSRHTPAAGLRESTVRKLSSIVRWSEQRDRWRELMRAGSIQERPTLCSVLKPATQP